MIAAEAGMSVNRNVRLVRPLDSGSMGAVWVGEHLTLDTEVAVKFIDAATKLDAAEAERRFEIEARAAARIKSPNVVQVFDHGLTEAGRPYIVMELLDGESLADRLERTGWVAPTLASTVVAQVSAALGAAHQAGVIHRDVKPDNIFLCAGHHGPFVKLLDFGVACSSEEEDAWLTVPGALVGTLEYLSREQVLRTTDVTEHADLWALAVVAYELITGDVPFTGDTLGAICMAICKGDFPKPSELRKGVPPAVDQWFTRAFAAETSQRFSSADELAKTFAESMTDFRPRPRPAGHLSAQVMTSPGLGRHSSPGERAALGSKNASSKPPQAAPARGKTARGKTGKTAREKTKRYAEIDGVAPASHAPKQDDGGEPRRLEGRAGVVEAQSDDLAAAAQRRRKRAIGRAVVAGVMLTALFLCLVVLSSEHQKPRTASTAFPPAPDVLSTAPAPTPESTHAESPPADPSPEESTPAESTRQETATSTKRPAAASNAFSPPPPVPREEPAEDAPPDPPEQESFDARADYGF